MTYPTTLQYGTTSFVMGVTGDDSSGVMSGLELYQPQAAPNPPRPSSALLA
jgi:hypothetical protein